MTKNVTDTVTVSGEVLGGARVPLSVGGDHLLDVIAAAGGAKAPVYQTFVQLTREGVTVTIPLEQLVSNPAENIYAWPGDTLTLVQLPQTYSVFGATTANSQTPSRTEDQLGRGAREIRRVGRCTGRSAGRVPVPL